MPDKAAIDASADDAVLGAELAGGRGACCLDPRPVADTQHQETASRATPLTQPEAPTSARRPRRARHFVRGRGLVDGNIKVRVGAQVTLDGLGPLFDGPYYVTRARHNFHPGGRVPHQFRLRAAGDREVIAMLDHFDGFAAALERNRLHGAYPAQVVDIKDPDGEGKVKIVAVDPDSGSGSYQVWARMALLMAGNNRSTWFIPDPNDEVLVAFEGGDGRRPYVVGMLWNGKDAPPETMDGSGNNFKKTIRSRNGVVITMDDTDGSESLTLKTPAGQTVTLKDGPGSIELQDANGNDIKADPSASRSPRLRRSRSAARQR